MSEIRVGDVVRLKSGSPALTVMGPGVDDDDKLECCWFQGYELYTLEAMPVCLVRLEPPVEDASS